MLSSKFVYCFSEYIFPSYMLKNLFCFVFVLRSYEEGDEDEFRRLSHAIHGRPTAIASTSQSRQRIQLQILARLLVQTSS